MCLNDSNVHLTELDFIDPFGMSSWGKFEVPVA